MNRLSLVSAKEYSKTKSLQIELEQEQTPAMLKLKFKSFVAPGIYVPYSSNRGDLA